MASGGMASDAAAWARGVVCIRTLVLLLLFATTYGAVGGRATAATSPNDWRSKEELGSPTHYSQPSTSKARGLSLQQQDELLGRLFLKPLASVSLGAAPAQGSAEVLRESDKPPAGTPNEANAKEASSLDLSASSSESPPREAVAAMANGAKGNSGNASTSTTTTLEAPPIHFIHVASPLDNTQNSHVNAADSTSWLQVIAAYLFSDSPLHSFLAPPVYNGSNDAAKAEPSSATPQRLKRTAAAAAGPPTDASNTPNANSYFNPFRETTTIVADGEKAVVPVTMVGSGYTVVRFDVKAGNTVNTVLQMKDHRYNASVPSTNCYNMYLTADLRNHYTSSNRQRTTVSVAGGGDESGSDDGRVQYDRQDGSAAAAATKDSDYATEDISAGGRGSWAIFWDSFALLFDTSALCNVLPTVSMRVSNAPVSEAYYVVIRSTTGSTYYSPNYYNLTTSYPFGDADSIYQCQMEVFIEQWPAAKQEKLQFYFAFLIPLIVLLLPLPFTLYRADLIQQFMMDVDLAQWVWYPPYYARDRIFNGMKYLGQTIIRLKERRRQQALRVRHQQMLLQASNGTAAPEPAVTVQPSLQPPMTLSSSADRVCEDGASPESFQGHRPFGSRSIHSPHSSICSTSSDVEEDERARSGRSARQHREDRDQTSVHIPQCPMTPEQPPVQELNPHLSAPVQRCSYGGGERGATTAASAVPSAPALPALSAPAAATGVTRSWRADRNSARDLLFTTVEESYGEKYKLLACNSANRQETAAGGGSSGAAVNASPMGPAVSPELSTPSPADGACYMASKKGGTAVGCSAAEEEEEPFCRICREGEEVGRLVEPCECTGSVRFVHNACLDRWRLESAKRNMSHVNHCEICKKPFQIAIQRSTLLWESSQHLIRGALLFLTCFATIVMTTSASHAILGELSCSASYHEVAYSTMFQFEGLSLSLFIYCMAVLMVLYANLVVYSWFRSRRDVEEYIEEMHTIPPFYTTRNIWMIVLLCLVLLAQVMATGFLLKYFFYNTSNGVWSWEISPLVGGMLLTLFTTCGIGASSWMRQVYVEQWVRGRGVQAEDVVVDPGNPGPQADTGAAAPSAGVDLNPTAQPSGIVADASGNEATPTTATPAAPCTVRDSSPASSAKATQEDLDLNYTRHFEIPPEQRVIRAFEYCPPRRRAPKG